MAQPRGRLSRTAFTTTTPQKRGAPPATPLRQSKRTKSTSDTPATNKTTPKKSEYFEQGSDLSGPSDLETTAENASNFEGDEDSAAPSSESEDGSDAYDSEEEQPKRRRSGAGRTNTKAKAPPASKAKGQKSGGELWREGTKVEADPGTEVYIALPKARGPGSTPYRDDTIHPNTMLFLGDLKKHNDRAWLKAHDPDFRQSQKDFASFVDTITERLMSEYDDTLPELPAKDLVFRIYRDVRFSKDPTPYKTHFAAAWSRTGRKGEYAHYYVQIAPGECFVGGGKWMPEKPVLDQLRQDVTDHPKRIRKALLSAGIRKHYLGDIKSSEDQAVKAFRKHNEENAFKRTPQGWDDSGPNGSLVYLRNWTIGRKLKDGEVRGPMGLERVLELLGAMTPYITYMNKALKPDDADSSSSEESDDDSDEDPSGTNDSAPEDAE